MARSPVLDELNEKSLKPKGGWFHRFLTAVAYHGDTTLRGRYTMQTTVRRKEDIETLLAHGLAPITDNVEALRELGFAPSFPATNSGYAAAIWERSIDHGYRATGEGLRRVMARQRAFVRGVAPDRRA